MKITNIEIIPAFIPWKKTPPVSSRAQGKRACSVVKVSTDEGITGYSEAAITGYPETAIRAFMEEWIEPLLLGENPMNVERLWDKVYRQSLGHNNNRQGAAITALGALEIALWDIIGKARKIPIYEMIGGLCKNKVKAYASLMGYDTPAEVAETALHCVDEGYTAIKLHQARNTIPSVKAVREAVGDQVTMMLDVSGAWSPRQAVENAKILEQYNIFWLEEPIWPVDDYHGLAYLRERTSIPIAGGESDNTHYGFRELITSQAIDIIQPDVATAGGILTCRKIFALAEAWNLQIAIHSFTFGPALAAAVHLSLSNTRSEYVEVCYTPIDEYYMQPPLRQEKGYLALPDKPGLGIEIDEKVLKKYASR
jgi:L-alanine-DL-glutamate epimerase-like enolase superfamily enzyme